MGFFGNIANVAKGIFNDTKRAVGGVQSGIRKGITVGRTVLDVGRDVYRQAKAIPFLGRYVAAYEPAVDAGLNAAEQGLKSAEDFAGGLDKAREGLDRAGEIGRTLQDGYERVRGQFR